eukprot:Skav217497  [mRNA]  locus=scaffold2951:71854:86651:- [translate_table: standard]
MDLSLNPQPLLPNLPWVPVQSELSTGKAWIPPPGGDPPAANGSLQEDEALKKITVEWEGKKGTLAVESCDQSPGQRNGEFTRRVVRMWRAGSRLAIKFMDELNQLNITVRQVQEYNDQMKAEIQVTRRATYKAEDHIKQMEDVKTKQDLLIDSMNEDIKRLTDKKALLDSQISAQKQETEAAMATLREASREMEAIQFEKCLR